MIFDSRQMIEFLHCIAQSTTIEKGRLVFSCESLAHMLSSLTGLTVNADWLQQALG